MKKELDIGLVVALVFSVIGYLVVIMGICTATVGFEYAFVGEKETGIITDIAQRNFGGNIDYLVKVDYVYDGEQYTEFMPNYTDDMYVGKEVSFKVSKDAPGNIIVPEGELGGGLAVTAFGVVFAGLGTLNLVLWIKKYKKKRELITQGRVIYATVDKIDMNYHVRSNYAHHFVIFCVYQEEYSDMSYTFRSDDIWEDPTNLFPKGSQVPVYVHGRDYSEYYVDLERALQERRQKQN